MPHVREHIDRPGLSESETRQLIRKVKISQSDRMEIVHAVRDEIAKLGAEIDRLGTEVSRLKSWERRSVIRH